MTSTVAAVLLLALLLTLVAAMVWQEARKRPVADSPTYILEEAVRFVWPRLSDRAMERLDSDDVRRILEWEVVYLQGGTPRRAGPLEGRRVAGSDAAARFVAERLATGGVARYAEEDIREVLAQEAAYLLDIGAVGTEVTGEAG